MAWVRVDDKMARGPKVKRAAAMLGGKFPRRRILSVWLEAMSYCNLNLTDGFVPDYEVADLEDERPAEVFRCMSAGDDTLGAIVERDDQRGGWVFRNYLDYQPSKASIEEKAGIDRKRKAEYRASKIRPRVSQECPNGTDTDGEEVSATTGPTRPEPTRPDPSPIQELHTTKVKIVSSEPAEIAVSEPPLLTFTAVGTGAKTWTLFPSQVASWSDAFPGLDVLAECRKAHVWLEANTQKRKTATGMPRFLAAWLTRATDRDTRAYQGKETQGARLTRVHEAVVQMHSGRPERPSLAPTRPLRQVGGER